MKQSDLAPLTQALKACRVASGLTQGELAEELGISRKTYLLMETRRWVPPARERSHFVKRLHELHPPAARAFAEVLGRSLEDYVQVRPVTPGSAAVPLEAAHAKLVFDSAVLGVAEHLDMSPRILRPILAALLERLAASGMPLPQAASLAKAAIAAPLAGHREKA